VLAEFGMRCSGLSPDGSLVEMIELPDIPGSSAASSIPAQVAPMRPHPLFAGFVRRARPPQAPSARGTLARPRRLTD
jgi:CTP synthase